MSFCKKKQANQQHYIVTIILSHTKEKTIYLSMCFTIANMTHFNVTTITLLMMSAFLSHLLSNISGENGY